MLTVDINTPTQYMLKNTNTTEYRNKEHQLYFYTLIQ